MKACWNELFALGMAQCSSIMNVGTILSAIINHLQTSLQEGTNGPWCTGRLKPDPHTHTAVCLLQRNFQQSESSWSWSTFGGCRSSATACWNSALTLMSTPTWKPSCSSALVCRQLLRSSQEWDVCPHCVCACVSSVPDHPGIDNTPQIERFQEKAYMELQDYVTRTYPEDSYRSVPSGCPRGREAACTAHVWLPAFSFFRLSKLLVRLPALRLISAAVTEELFFAGLIGNVQIDSIIPYILKMETTDYNSQADSGVWRTSCLSFRLLSRENNGITKWSRRSVFRIQNPAGILFSRFLTSHSETIRGKTKWRPVQE